MYNIHISAVLYCFKEINMKNILVIPFVLFLSLSPIFAQDGGEWIYYSMQEYVPYFYKQDVLTTGKNNELWGAADSVIFHFDGVSWEIYTFDEIGTENHVSSILFDDSENLHVLSGNYITFQNNTWSSWSGENDCPSGKNPIDIDIAPNGDVWVGTESSGLFCYNGLSWMNYLPENEFQIYTIAVDLAGHVWCGTKSNGVLYFDGETWLHYTEEHGLGEILDIIVKVGPDGTIWLSGAKANIADTPKLEVYFTEWIARYEGEQKWKVMKEDPLYQPAHNLEIDKTGKVWLSYIQSFASYDGAEWNEYYLPDPRLVIVSFTVDSDGVIWIVTVRGGVHRNELYRFDPNAVTVDDTIDSSVPVIVTSNCPNPFNPSTTIVFTLPEANHTRLNIYNFAGQNIRTLVDASLSAGTHQVVFDGSGFSSGMYFYHIESGNYDSSGKMVLVK